MSKPTRYARWHLMESMQKKNQCGVASAINSAGINRDMYRLCIGASAIISYQVFKSLSIRNISSPRGLALLLFSVTSFKPALNARENTLTIRAGEAWEEKLKDLEFERFNNYNL